MGCHLTAPPAEPVLRLEFHPNLTALVEAEVSFITPLAHSQEPRHALPCQRSLNGVCRAPDHVEHEAGGGEHGDVAAVDLIGGGAHPLRHEALQLGWDGVVVLGHDVPARLQPPGGPLSVAAEPVPALRAPARPDAP